ncbi:hypothetical protein SAMN04487946_101474 [Halobellus clavatus]|uniref:Uncharacterized protein n=1 Tax=Halobellus clavatus TaxID=660517 RepID=A0A1H3DCG2_9EURY|nr:hypothetical protein SAMN04487946_101474 [Halobellus clavatus]
MCYLPTGTEQWYIRDPSENPIEINDPEVDDIDESLVRIIVEREDVEPGGGGDNYGECECHSAED